MDLQVFVVPDCPHEGAALTAMRTAAVHAGLNDPTVSRIVVATDAQAQALHFRGSPTFAVDGHDEVTPLPRTPIL